MESWIKITYTWVAVNVVASVLFNLAAIIFGGRDLIRLIRSLAAQKTDETDDGRVIHH